MYNKKRNKNNTKEDHYLEKNINVDVNVPKSYLKKYIQLRNN